MRDRRQCRERWMNYLSPAVYKGPWTPQEEALLRNKVNELGRRWKSMEPFFPGRTDINIKNHWKQMQPLDKQQNSPTEPKPHGDDLFATLTSSWWQDEPEMPYPAGEYCQEDPLW